MEPYFGILVIAIITIVIVAILGFVSVHITTRKYVPDAAGASKALALTLVSYVGSGVLLSLEMKLTDDKPGPFGYVTPTQIWIKITGAVIAWILAIFGTWHLTKKMYATTNRQTTTIAWQLLCIISLYFGITVWKLISWMVQTSGYR
jgi:amino acid permease